jgi:enoyl-CoA hydratase/carnithine racemase
MTTYEFITYEKDDDGIATITLNRPDRLNAINSEIGQELIKVLDEVDADPDVRAVILTGAGRAFCAGADLKAGAAAFAPKPDGSSSSDVLRDWGGVLVLRIFSLTKPIIAAINGASVGVGATMTLPCDVRLASKTAKFGFVFARRGIITDGCASWFLPRIVGISTALKWCMTGSLLPAQEALEAGLVDSIHEPEDLLEAAREIALGFSTNTSAVSVSLIRQLLWRGLVEDHPMASHRYETILIGATSAGADAREGVESFIENRPALFPGRVPADLPKEWPLWEEPDYENAST